MYNFKSKCIKVKKITDLLFVQNNKALFSSLIIVIGSKNL
jgi:hypothetical protein